MKAEKSKRRVWLRMLIVALLIAGVLLFPVLIIGSSSPSWSPQWLTNYAHDVRLYVFAPASKVVLSALQGSIQDNRIYNFRDATTREKDTILTDDGLQLVATNYAPKSSTDPRPVVLLLHGSTPEGRFMGLYRALGNELAKAGFLVIVPDQRGYGSSDDPDPKDATTFRFIDDVSSMIDYALSLENVDPERVYILGHSFGGGVAVAGGVQDDRVAGIISFAPSRRLLGRAEEEIDYFRRREMRYMFLNSNIPEQTYLDYITPILIDNQVEYFATEEHTPLLLLDGELENAEDRAFLADLVAQMTGDVTYVTLENSDHYANTAGFMGPLIIYDKPVFENLVQTIVDWLNNLAE